MTGQDGNLLRANRAQLDISERAADAAGASSVSTASSVASAVEGSNAIDTLDPRRRVAIGMMIRGYHGNLIAETLGVARSTIWNWKQEPAFRTALREELDRHLGDLPDAGRDVLRHALVIVQQKMLDGGEDALKASLAILRSGRVWQAIAGTPAKPPVTPVES